MGGGPRAGHEPRDCGPGREVPLDAGLDPKSLGPVVSVSSWPGPGGRTRIWLNYRVLMRFGSTQKKCRMLVKASGPPGKVTAFKFSQ